jgi:hypothetical protein
VFLATASFASAVVAACDPSAGPSGKGDDILNDTRDSSVRAPANPDDGAVPTGQPDGDLVFEPDGAIEVEYPDASGASYPGLAACSACSCPAAHLYCFGGAPRQMQMQVRPAPAGADAASDATTSSGADAASFDGAAAQTTDAAAGARGPDASTACPLESAGAIGCTALPASCTNQDETKDCPCLLALLQPLYDCPLDCAYDGKTSRVYCPNP